jgi:uncharacterized membrane protein YoaK (UPF0700 family)
MFRHEGLARTARENRLVAGCLALVGGFVNSAGFVLIGAFTSHVTGNVGRLANDVARRDPGAAAGALALVAAFLAGAFVASVCIESRVFGSRSSAYGAALSCEATALVVFTVVASTTVTTHLRLRDMEAALLCAAMGMQNSLVTRLSGAVVRTTHLTGVVTDVGIEAARWFQWWRGKLSATLGVKLSSGGRPAARPSAEKITLLATIASAFTTGAVTGGTAALAFGHAAMIVPCVAVGGSAVYAFVIGRRGERQLAEGIRGEGEGASR